MTSQIMPCAISEGPAVHSEFSLPTRFRNPLGVLPTGSRAARSLASSARPSAIPYPSDSSASLGFIVAALLDLVEESLLEALSLAAEAGDVHAPRLQYQPQEVLLGGRLVRDPHDPAKSPTR